MCVCVGGGAALGVKPEACICTELQPCSLKKKVYSFVGLWFVFTIFCFFFGDSISLGCSVAEAGLRFAGLLLLPPTLLGLQSVLVLPNVCVSHNPGTSCCLLLCSSFSCLDHLDSPLLYTFRCLQKWVFVSTISRCT